MNLDERIVQKRDEALSKGSLDVNIFDDSINVYMIYADIEREARGLKPIGKGKYETYAVDEAFVSTSFLDRLRGLDDKMKRFRFYRLHVRGFLKKIYKRVKHNQTVDVGPLLGLGYEEFVKACYEKILLRDLDREGAYHHVNRLHNREISKLELIYEFARSEEGCQKGIKLRGRKIRYQSLRFFRKLFRVPVVGRVFRFIYNLFGINRVINSLVNWNRDIVVRADKLEQLCGALEGHIEASERHIEALERHIEALERGVEEERNFSSSFVSSYEDRMEPLELNVRNNNTLLEKYEGLFEKHQISIDQYEDDINNLIVQVSNLNAARSSMKPAVVEIKGEKQQNTNVEEVVSGADSYYSIDYFDFENRFRGSQEHVKNAQRIYLPYFKACENVVDIGCGRGEFVELLVENGIGIKGVDLYLPYVEYGKMNGLPVFHGDGIEFLKQQEQVDGIFVGQVVEHISVQQIIELCAVAYEKLTDGSYLIMETPNPTSLAIYTESFYRDPSHNKPVHPETLKYITEKRGFSDVQILYTEGSRLPYHIPKLSDENEGREHEFDVAMQRVENLLYGSQDYAVIAKK